ncbi:hypothetical protein Clacol_007850 [Clathrus columnatus]|uniref:Uncharacterized protein n=1 Tax=Clathrus columnatus TaxID=1419009 RepID=A0AAV5AKD6_9AGAM|nr:hypothetical protein Clacol_007850 [Clathrus columnatus]
MTSSANAQPDLPSSFPVLPPGTSLAGDIQGTFGVVIIAIIISAFLTGILTMQLFTYYSSFPRDSVVRKSLVALIYLLDFGQFICITDFAWWYLVRNWGNVNALAIIRPTYGLFVIYALNSQFRYLSVPIFILIGVEFAFGMIGANFGIRVKPFTSISTKGFNASVVAVWLGSGVAADIGLAAALSYILHTNRTGFRKTERASLRSKETSNTISSNGVFAHSDQTTDFNITDHSIYSPGQQSTLVPVQAEPKPSTEDERNGSFEYELYPMRNKAPGDMDPS